MSKVRGTSNYYWLCYLILMNPGFNRHPNTLKMLLENLNFQISNKLTSGWVLTNKKYDDIYCL